MLVSAVNQNIPDYIWCFVQKKKRGLMAYSGKECLDQPTHSHSLITALFIHLQNQWTYFSMYLSQDEKSVQPY